MQFNQDKGQPVHSHHSTQLNELDFPLRVLLYSHDSVGLGHLRRNLAIANEIRASFPNSSILIVTGSPCATQFQLPDNTDMIKIPSISKDIKGQYVPLDKSASLEETLKFRSEIILDSFRLFKPALIIVDHQLTGLKGEALEMLREAKNKGVLTIYGSRDIKDSPQVVKTNWSRPESQWAIRHGYDRVCVYGMQELFDPRKVYSPCLDGAVKVDFTGYIIPPVKKIEKKASVGRRKKVLVTFGGGGDGMRRAEAYLQALKLKPVNWDSHIITGPLMDKDVKRKLRKQAQTIEPIGSVRTQRFHRNIPALLQQVDAVVSMAGYNSCTEILQSGVPAVLLPRSFPRKEQLIRSRVLAEQGWVTYLKEEDIRPESLLSKIECALASPRRSQPGPDLNGLNRLTGIIHELLCEAGFMTKMPKLNQPQRSAN